MTTKQGLKLSAIIDKLEIKIDDPKGDLEKVGADMMVQIVSKAHKAEREIYEFIAGLSGLTVDQVKKLGIEDLKNMFTEFGKNAGGLVSFFKSAAK